VVVVVAVYLPPAAAAAEDAMAMTTTTILKENQFYNLQNDVARNACGVQEKPTRRSGTNYTHTILSSWDEMGR